MKRYSLYVKCGGTLFIVSHDRYLMNKIADRIYYLDQNGAEEYIGNYDYYIEKSSEIANEAAKNAPAKPNEYKLQKEREAAIRKEKADLKRCENQIDEIEGKMNQLQSELLKPEISSNYEAALEITEKIESLRVQSEELFQHWSALAQKIEQ
jgi:ATP-binding cassette subfamily F protein 3